MQNRTAGWFVGALLGAAAVVGVGGWLAQQGAAAADTQSGPRKPVLVELFTSEGCSSCPPADTLLAKLDQTQPIPGVHAIVLSEHVTYWDRQGWHDPFSLDSITDRQHWYADKFGLGDVYTPQAVVDGTAQFVGSDGRKLGQAIVAAAAAEKEELTLGDAAWDGDAVRFSVHGGAAGKAKAMLMAALAEDSAQTSVKSGENAGRVLQHVAVVRVLKEMGTGADDGRALTLKLPGGSAPSSPLRLVVFLVDKHSGHVLGATEQTIVRK